MWLSQQNKQANSDTPPKLKTFYLYRKEDETGVSGTGVVAVGIILPSGKAIIEWTTTQAGVPGLGIYDSIEGVKDIHGHGGNTDIRYYDDGQDEY